MRRPQRIGRERTAELPDGRPVEENPFVIAIGRAGLPVVPTGGVPRSAPSIEKGTAVTPVSIVPSTAANSQVNHIAVAGDTSPAVVWQQAAGQCQMQSLSVTALFLVNDGLFDTVSSDGRWQTNSGEANIWKVSGTTVLTATNNWQAPGSSWNIKGSGDADADSTSDMVWRNSERLCLPLGAARDHCDWEISGKSPSGPARHWNRTFQWRRVHHMLWQNHSSEIYF
jgi:hypothetical protein